MGMILAFVFFKKKKKLKVCVILMRERRQVGWARGRKGLGGVGIGKTIVRI